MRRLMPVLIAGVVLGINEVFFAISLVSLIFSGPLEPYLSIGIGISLVATIIFIGIGLFSSVRGTIITIQDATTVILAMIAGSLAARLVGDELLPTVLVSLALATLLTGIFLLALGLLKLGGLIRYIPYPVVGGFLAGTGWLLVQGTFGTLTGTLLTLGNLPELLLPANLVLWAPSVIFGFTLVIGLRKIHSPVIMPVLLVAGLVCLLILAFGTTLLAYFRMPIVGGLLFFLGLGFLFEWVILGWKRFSRLEYGIVLLILAVIVTTNFMLGVAIGLIAMLLIFVVSYSRTKVVKHEFSGADIDID